MRHFVEELDQLSNMLLEMCSCVEAAVQRSISAVTEKDIYAAEEVLRNEARINQIEIEIDDFAISLLALHQPMAADLRLIVAALKINTDLERMGDLAVNIAQRAKSLMRGSADQADGGHSAYRRVGADRWCARAWTRLWSATRNWRAACWLQTPRWTICARPAITS